MTPTKFISLRSGNLREIQGVLADNVVIIDPTISSAIKLLIAEFGYIRAIKKVFMYTIQSKGERVKGYALDNIARKTVRFPKVFGNRIIRNTYIQLKAIRSAFSELVIIDTLKRHPEHVPLVFNGTMSPDNILLACAKDRPHLFVEGGYFANTLQVDPIGINANSSVPTNKDFYSSYTVDDRSFPVEIGTRVSKRSDHESGALPENFVFVPFQVPTDMQITKLSPWIKDMESFYGVLERAVDVFPELIFVVKEHPSFKRSVIGSVRKNPNIRFFNTTPTEELIRKSSSVVTINSTVGIEALIFEKKIITLGRSVYNIEDLVLHANNEHEFHQAFTMIDEWSPDASLREKFLHYIYYEFLIPGTIRKPDPDTYAFFVKRLLNNRSQP